MKRLLALSFLLVATSAPAAELTPRERGDLTIRSRAILKKYCSVCHKPTGPSFDILDHTILTAKHPISFVDPKAGSRSQIIEFLEDGSMPPAGKKRPSDEEIKVLRDWIAAGAPQYPKAFDQEYVLNAVHADWQKQKPPENYRYISFADVIRDTTEDLESEEARLRGAIEASTTKPVEFLAVDSAATIFRLDIQKLGWTSREAFQPAKGGEPHPLTPFDLILLENPFPLADAKTEMLLPKPRVAASVPYLQGNWLADALAPGSPLAADMRSLVELQDAKEAPCGPKPRMFEKPKTPAVTLSPITAWYSTAGAEPFKLEFTINSSTTPTVGPSENLKFEVKSDVNAQFRMFRILADGYTTIQPVATGEFLTRNEPRPLQPAKGFFKSPDLKEGAESTVEYFVLVVSPRENPIPVPTVVRSMHVDGCEKEGRAPIYRILFDKDDKFDPAKAVRKIVPVTVTKKK